MSEEKLTCGSCNKRIVNDAGSVKFKCPQCGETDIIRCKKCRLNVVKYVCSKCGFDGPN